MLILNEDDLIEGVEYFCVHEGSVYYLTARKEDLTDMPVFFHEDIHGGCEYKFHAYECSLIYKL